MSEGAHVKMRASKMVREHVVSDLERMNEGVHVIMRARKKARMYESLHHLRVTCDKGRKL